MQSIVLVLRGNRAKIEVTIDLSGSMLDAEEPISRMLNAGDKYRQ
jgi:hypothetical protein